jgi:large subunit ribosomal protein L4
MDTVSLKVLNWSADVVETFELDLTGKTKELDKSFIKSYLYKLRLRFRGENKFGHTKGISQISGTTKKPYKQKGTGNARQGSLRSPQFRGGATIFGPLAITRKVSILKKEVKSAKRMLLSYLVKSSRVTVIKDANLENHKTRNIVDFSNKILNGKRNHEKGILLITSEDEQNANILRATNNLFWISVRTTKTVTPWSLIFCKNVVFTKKAISEIFDLI